MTTPIEDLIKPLTEEQVLETYLSALETLDLKPRSWRAGGIARSILRVCARTTATFTTVMAAFIRMGFLETAEGVWLTRVAKYIYGVDRKPATFATGKVTLTNAGGVHGPFVPYQARVKNTTTGKVYAITEAFTLNSNQSVTLAIQAVEVGAASSSGAGTITGLETAMIGVTLSNAEPVNGSDEEKDPDLRQRCTDKLAALSVRGARGAYRYAVLSAQRPDGSYVDINRVTISPSSSNGTVTITCASPSGPPVASDLDYVRDSVEKWARPDSVTAVVQGATSVVVAKTIDVWATKTDGLTAADLAALVQAALAPITRDYPIGGIAKPPDTQGYLYSDYLAGVVKSAHASTFDVDGFGGDTAIGATEVVTLNVTVTPRFVEVS